MKLIAYSAMALAALSACLAFGEEIASPWRNEAKVWEKHKEEVYQVYEKLALPPKGTEIEEVKRVFRGKITEKKMKERDKTRISIPFFLRGDITHPRNKMYCLIHITAVGGKVLDSKLTFTASDTINVDGKEKPDPFETDYKLVGLLKGYLNWKDTLSQASWNRTPDKPDAGDGK